MMDYDYEPETRAMLEKARSPGREYVPDELRRAACLYPLDALLAGYLSSLGLPLISYYEFRRYCRSLTGAFRKYSGERLAVEIEVAMARWRTWGLDPLLLQRVAVEAWDRLNAKAKEPMAENAKPVSTLGRKDAAAFRHALEK